MSDGPGPRHGRRPTSARSLTAGEPVPSTVIPLEYRNDDESRARMALLWLFRKAPPPWIDDEAARLGFPLPPFGRGVW